MAKKENRSVDPATLAMLDRACDADIPLAWDRLESQEPQCGFGRLGICCRHCAMGPCRIDPFGDGAQKGVCGATGACVSSYALALLVDVLSGVL